MHVHKDVEKYFQVHCVERFSSLGYELLEFFYTVSVSLTAFQGKWELLGGWPFQIT